MKLLDSYSERWIAAWERKKGELPFSFVLMLLGLGAALSFFGFIDRVWAYYLEACVAVGAALILFVAETAWRRIAELKSYLAEYRKKDRAVATTSVDAADDFLPQESELDEAELADREERSMSQGQMRRVGRLGEPSLP